jgi:hypothetical protein
VGDRNILFLDEIGCSAVTNRDFLVSTSAKLSNLVFKARKALKEFQFSSAGLKFGASSQAVAGIIRFL